MVAPDEVAKLAIGVTIVGVLLPVFFGLGSGGLGADAATITATGAGTTTTLDPTDERPDNLQVRATRGNAIQLEGSAVTSTTTDNVTDGSWTLCAVGRLAADADIDATYTLAAADNGTALLLYANETWVAYYQNASTGDTAKATLTASSPQSSLTPVCGRYDDATGELVVMADGTVSAPDTADATTDSRSVAHDWHGTIDELRAFDEAVGNSTLTAYASDPIQPFPSTQRTARMMFDEGDGTTTTVYFAAEDASIGSASWTDGVAGPGLSEGTDYDLAVDPLEITILAGSYVVGAPVVFVSWGSGFPIPLWDVLSLFAALFVLGMIAVKLTDTI